MFKPLANLLHRTPWWGMAFFGLITFIALVVFTVPFQVIRLEKAGATAAENQAIKREVDAAFAGQGLDIAENFVKAFKSRTTDPVRQIELERALEEIQRAREEIEEVGRVTAEARREAERAASDAKQDARRAMRDATREARRAARDGLVAASEAAVEGADAALQGQKSALAALRDAGIKDAQVEAQIQAGIRQAEQNLAQARRQLEAAKKSEGSVGIRINLGDEKPAFQIDVDDPDAGNEKSAAAGAKSTPPGKPDAKAEVKANAKSTAKGDGVYFDGTIAGARVTGNIGGSADAKTMPKALSPPAAPRAPGKPDVIAALTPPAPPAAPLPPLPPTLPSELRADIHEKVADDFFRLTFGAILIITFIPLFIMALIAKFFIDRARVAQRVAEEKKQEADFHAMGRQVTEARLMALQAQVEPHFLYNTLANVQALTEADPPLASKMVEHLIQYLRAALPKMRETTSTVGQEMELVRAYLNILKIRMGARLEFSINLPDDVAKLPFPPLMLPSLIENAIKHGLEPQREGGRIDITASRLAGLISIEVKDTGRGFGTGTSGGGVGLANIRERLAGLYGPEAKLTLAENEPQGVIATLQVPDAPPRATPASAGAASATFTATTSPTGSTTMGSRIWGGVKMAHNIWFRIAGYTFIALMGVLAVAFVIAMVGTYSGLLPVEIGDAKLSGVHGFALGTLILLAAFAVLAVVSLVLVALFYGLGVMAAALAIIIPLIVLVSLFPVLLPFVLLGGIIWWFSRKKKADSLPNISR
ncbi:MAG: histidine kinase [Betaproteobacteria bacterium]|nr:histidine kinase [Betaproteobacteria bacterium]